MAKQGTVQAIYEAYQAANPLHNVTYLQAKQFVDLYNATGVQALAVTDIIAIPVKKGGESITFRTLSSYGVGQDVPLYLGLLRGPLPEDVSEVVSNLEVVGNSIRLAGQHADPVNRFVSLVQAAVPGTSNDTAKSWLFGVPSVQSAAGEFINKFGV